MTNGRFAVAACAVLTFTAIAATAHLPETHLDDHRTPARQVILTDLQKMQGQGGSGDPDDAETMVRTLLYSNEIDIAGIVVLPEAQGSIVELEKILHAYADVRPNLLLHDRRYPAADQIRSVVKVGQPGLGIQYAGEDQVLSDGARLIISEVDKSDPRPLWITVWGWPNTLARALNHVRATRTPDAVAEFVAKIRVYAIADQDDSGIWIRNHFPDLFYIVMPSLPGGWKTYGAGAWTGMGGSGGDEALSSKAWLAANIQSKGPLGKVYPTWIYTMEGDTPSWFGLVQNGLASFMNPGWGGWGGRYVYHNPPNPYTRETRAFWTQGAGASDSVANADGTVTTTDWATVHRWRQHYQYDFSNRMDWTIKPYAEANHAPRAVVNGDASQRPLFVAATVGVPLTLSAAGSTDPDGDRLTYRWYHYREAGTLGADADAGRVTSPQVTLSTATGPQTTVTPAGPGAAHVILEATDNGRGFPSTSYRRIVLNATAR